MVEKKYKLSTSNCVPFVDCEATAAAAAAAATEGDRGSDRQSGVGWP